jgi:hypothetical protein
MPAVTVTTGSPARAVYSLLVFLRESQYPIRSARVTGVCTDGTYLEWDDSGPPAAGMTAQRCYDDIVRILEADAP